MLRNYWKLAIRNLKRNRGFAAINIFGLALGMGSFLLIALHINDELSFDAFHEDADLIYRVVEQLKEGDQAGQQKTQIGFQIPMQAEEALPEVDQSLVVFNTGRRTMVHADVQFHEPFNFAKESFFEVFTYKLLSGDPATALDRPNSIVLSESMAKKYFGTADVYGETILAGDWELEITAVMADLPSNSHLQFESLVSLATLKQRIPRVEGQLAGDFMSSNFTSYLKLREEADPLETAQKLNDWVSSHRPDSLKTLSEFSLQPLKDIHLYSGDMVQQFNEASGDGDYIVVFLIIGIFILLIASINYTNLATALATRRAREVGMRKVLGSMRKQLIWQFLLESFLIASISLIIGFSLVQLALPAYNQWSGRELSLSLLHWDVYALLAGVVIIVSLLAGSYPAFFLSKFSPAIVLKGVEKAINRKFGLRELLVVIQFGISALLLLATAIMFQQLQYLQEKDLGFQKDGQLVVDINSGVARNQFEEMKTAFMSLSSVEAVSVTSRVPGEWKMIPRALVKDPAAPESNMEMIYMAADWDFLETYDVELLSGRNFRNSESEQGAILINESAAKLLGITSAEEQEVQITGAAFGSTVQMGPEPWATRVIGIVKDFHFEALHEPLKPVVISFYQNPIQSIDYYTLRINSRNPAQVIEDVEAAYYSVDPDHPIEWHFLSDQWAIKYQDDNRRGQLVGWFAGLGLLIACLGLFALASLTIQRRLREVAIRKVLGSSRGQLVRLLSYQFLKLVVFALVISVPLSIWLTQAWLQTFAYQANLSVGVMIGLTAGILLLAFLTVGVRTFTAAGQNPIHALYNE